MWSHGIMSHPSWKTVDQIETVPKLSMLACCCACCKCPCICRKSMHVYISSRGVKECSLETGYFHVAPVRSCCKSIGAHKPLCQRRDISFTTDQGIVSLSGHRLELYWKSGKFLHKYTSRDVRFMESPAPARLERPYSLPMKFLIRCDVSI